MIRKIGTSVIKLFKSKKINVFLLFLLTAFFVLVLAKLSKHYTNVLVFNIEKINVPQKYVILNDSSSSSVSITLKTHGFRWFKYYLKKPKIKIDFESDVYLKDSVFIWSKSKAYLNNTQFDSQVELLDISPDTLFFKSSVNMIKKVPVIIDSKIEFKQGYDILGTYETTPDSIQIVGPETVVSKISEVKTDKLVLLNRKSNIFETVKLILPDSKQALKFSNTKVTLKAQVEKFTEGNLKIPIELINVPDYVGVNFFPKEVNVSYSVSLSQYKHIRAKDFKVVCDYKSAEKNRSFMIPKLVKFPEEIKKVRIHQQRIEFIVR